MPTEADLPDAARSPIRCGGTLSRDLTSFPAAHGIVNAVDGVSFELSAARRSASSAKAARARASPPARSCRSSTAGRDRRRPHPARRRWQRRARSASLAAREPRHPGDPRRRIAMIFQEPMSSLSPVHTIGEQIIEVMRLHLRMTRSTARDRTVELLRQVEIPDARARWSTATRSSSPAACASAR